MGLQVQLCSKSGNEIQEKNKEKREDSFGDYLEKGEKKKQLFRKKEILIDRDFYMKIKGILYKALNYEQG